MYVARKRAMETLFQLLLFVAAVLCRFYAFLIKQVNGVAEFSVGSGENCSKLGAMDSHSAMWRVKNRGGWKMRPRFSPNP